MNMCILVLGTWFLRLDNGYNDVNFVNVANITSVTSGTRHTFIHILNGDSTVSGWIPEKDRYMTATETIELIRSCAE